MPKSRLLSMPILFYQSCITIPQEKFIPYSLHDQLGGSFSPLSGPTTIAMVSLMTSSTILNKPNYRYTEDSIMHYAESFFLSLFGFMRFGLKEFGIIRTKRNLSFDKIEKTSISSCQKFCRKSEVFISRSGTPYLANHFSIGCILMPSHRFHPKSPRYFCGGEGAQDSDHPV